MAIYKVNEQDLTDVANAIRAKSGKTEELVYPEEFVTEINQLAAGSDPRPKYTISGGSYITHLCTIDRYSGDGINDWLITIQTHGTCSSADDDNKDRFTLTFNELDTPVDIFVCGGGGSGGFYTADNYTGGGGGGGGRTTSAFNQTLTVGTEYSCYIGYGGQVYDETSHAGATTSCCGVSATGGYRGNGRTGGAGGSGGGGGGRLNTTNGGAGGSNGGNGETTHGTGGEGQGTTTYAFGSTSYPQFGAGGGGGAGVSSGTPVYSKAGAGVNGPALGEPGQNARISPRGWYVNRNNPNIVNSYGGGGWGGGPSASTTAGNGGNGIIMIRNARG